LRLFHPVVVCGEAGCREVKALIDTGASASFIHPRIVEDLRIRRTKYLKPIRIPGEVYRCPVVILKRLEIKGKIVEDALLTEFDTGNDMVIGADIIQDLGLKVDLVRGDLTSSNPGTPKPEVDEEKYWRYQLIKWRGLQEEAETRQPPTDLSWLIPIGIALPLIAIPLIWWISWMISPR